MDNYLMIMSSIENQQEAICNRLDKILKILRGISEKLELRNEKESTEVIKNNYTREQ